LNKDGRIGKNKSSNNQPKQQPASNHSLGDFLRVTSMTGEQARAQFPDREKFKTFASEKFDYISNGNMDRIHTELMGQGNGVNPPVGQRR